MVFTYSLIILAIGLLGVFVLNGCLAFWISTRDWHWLFRAIALIASIFIYVLIPDGKDLLLILLFQNLVIFAGVSYERARLNAIGVDQDRIKRQTIAIPKFQILDLMLFTLLVCIVLGMVFQFLNFGFLKTVHLIGIGCAFGISTLFAIAMNHWRLGWLKKYSLLMLLWSAGAIWAGLDDWWLIEVPVSLVAKLIVWFVLLFITNSIMAFTFFNAKAIWKNNDGKQFGRFRKGLAWISLPLVLIPMLFAVGYCYLSLTSQTNFELANKKPFVPNEPNGYSDFLAASKEFSKSNILSMSTPTPAGPTLDAEIAKYASAFELTEKGLTRKNQSWIDLSDKEQLAKFDAASTATINEVSSLREIARAYSMKAKQSVANNDFDTAMKDGLAINKISQNLTQDGFILTHLVGVAIEGMGNYVIQPVVEKASTKQLEESLAELKTTNQNCADYKRVMDLEFALMFKDATWRRKLVLKSIYYSGGINPAANTTANAIARQKVEQNLLITSIALELHKRENETYPNSLRELVPKYLDEVPKDTYTSDIPVKMLPLKYRLEKSGDYILYSVGMNGTDENGVAANTPTKGDYNFRAITRASSVTAPPAKNDPREEVEK